jgi:hypothetical protein
MGTDTHPEPSPDDLVNVRLVGLPVPVWSRAQEHADELIREFILIAGDRDHTSEREVPARLIDLVGELTAQYGGLNSEQEIQLAQAAADGVEALDLIFHLPPLAAQAATHLGAMFDAADEYCRTGKHLLTLATPAESLAFRRWYLGEFDRQISGEPPTSWPDWLGQRQPGSPS